MKTSLFIPLIFTSILLFTDSAYSQNHSSQSHIHRRMRKTYSPNWSRSEIYYRRWLYFPDHNIYWDNHYKLFLVYENKKWESKSSAPSSLAKLDLAKETKYALKANEDTVQMIFKNNAKHKLEYLGKKQNNE